MLEHRRLTLDLLALGLLATVIFLAAALWTFDPADPPSALVFPPHIEPVNVCGHWGAIASWLLFEVFGLGAYYVLLSLAVLDAVLLVRHEVGQPWLRAGGWLLSLVGVTILAALAGFGFPGCPIIGTGGYLGAIGRTLLQAHFANLGAYIIALSLIVGGLLLSTDYALVRLLAWPATAATRRFGRGVLHVGAAYAEKVQRRRSDLDSASAERRSAGPAVRLSGRAAAKAEDHKADKGAERPADDEADAHDEPAPAAADGRKTLGSRVGISRPKKEPKVLEEMEAEVGSSSSDYQLPGLELLLEGETPRFEAQEKEVRRKATILEKTFLDFGFTVRVVEIQTGPVIAQFEVELEAGLRLSRITGLADDLAIALRVPSVRIVAPLPGKNTVGVEVPNNERQVVRLREVMEEGGGKAQKMRIPVYLGKDVAGTPLVVDLTTLPHLLIAGRTGTGKSVCLNSIIASMLMTRRPDEVRMLMIDPKMVELSPYKCLPHLMHPVVTDMRKAEAILGWAVEKMEERYHLLARAGVRHISVYNQLGEEELMERIQPEDEEDRKQIPTHMPYIVIVADELADLMMTAAKEVEGHIIRLAQKSRAVGIHLVLATQKPTVDVITGLIKSNLPARIAFQVASRTDSRVVLDEMGADKLLGNGDLLFLWPGTSTLLRGQGTYLTDEEISRLIAAVATSEPQFVTELVQLKVTAGGGDGKKLSDRDELYEAAVDVVIRERRGSVSLLQRSLGIGYGRAARLIDFMEQDGIVGPYKGSQAREILMSVEQWEQMTGGGGESALPAAPAAPTKPPRGNRIVLPPAEKRPPAGQAFLSPGTIRTVKPVPDEGRSTDDEFAEFNEEDEEPPFDAGEEAEDEVDEAEPADGNDEEQDAERDEEDSDADDQDEDDGDEDGADEAGADADEEADEEAGDSGDEVEEPEPPARQGRKRWKAESALRKTRRLPLGAPTGRWSGEGRVRAKQMVLAAQRSNPWWLAREVRLCALALMGGLGVVLLFQAFRMAYRDVGYDFTSYLLAARALRDGSNPYQVAMPFPYLYPLFLAFALMPLTFVPYWLANAVWLVACLAGLVASCLLLERAGLPGGPAVAAWRLAVPGMAALMAFFPPIQNNMIQGQINPIVLFCAAMFFCCYARQAGSATLSAAGGRTTDGGLGTGRGQPRTLPRAGLPAPTAWAAAWLAAAIAIKVLPAVLLLFLVVRKQYRLLLWTCLLTAGFFLLPVLVAGRNLPAYYGSYFETFVWPALNRAMPNSPTHFSLQGAVGCFLPGLPFVWRKTLCSLAVLAALLNVERAAARSGGARGDIWPFCAYLLACLLLSPVVELHHFVLAAPAVFLLAVKAFFDRAWATRRVLLCLGASVACFQAAPWDETKLLYFAALAILLALLWLAAARPARG